MWANLNVISMITMEYNIYCITTQKQALICGTAIPSLNKIEYTESFHSINREGKYNFYVDVILLWLQLFRVELSLPYY